MYIDITIPYHGDRRHFVSGQINAIHGHPKVRNIVIVDDCSREDDYARSLKCFSAFNKVKVYRNEKNLFVFKNKIKAVSLCTSPWVLLLDSDNFFNQTAFEEFFRCVVSRNTVYSPCYARPHFDYRKYAGLILDRTNIANYLKKPMMTCLLNTMNYFLPRQEWLDAIEKNQFEGFAPVTADSIYINYLLFVGGMRMAVVPGLSYEHAVHSGSTYLSRQKEGVEIGKTIECLLKNINSGGKCGLSSI